MGRPAAGLDCEAVAGELLSAGIGAGADRSLLDCLLAHTPLAISVVDVPGFTYLLVNPMYQALAPGKDILGHRFADAWPEVKEPVEAMLEQVAASGLPFHQDNAPIRLRRGPDSAPELVYITYSCIPLLDGDGRVERILTLARETTAEVRQKQAEQALQASAAMLEAALASMSEGICLSDAQGRLIHVNDALVRHYRFSNREECLLGSAQRGELFEFSLPDGAPVARDDWPSARALRGEKVSRAEYNLRRTDTGETWVGSYSFGPIAGADGQVAGAVVVARDITESRRTQAELERVRTAVEEGQKIARWEYMAGTAMAVWSDEQFRLYGLEPGGEAPDFPTLLKKHVPPEDADPLMRTFQAALDSRSVFECEHRIMLPDGRIRYLQELARPYLNAAGELVKYIGISLDISERKLAEAEREQLLARLAEAQKAESIGRLAGGVAHDFNNLLTVINGYSQMMLAEFTEGHPLRRPAEQISEAGERAAYLTRQLLAYGRKQLLSPEPLDLNATVRDVEPMLRSLLGDDIAVETKLDQTIASVNVDRDQIRDVILHLAVNARDAMPAGGRLSIETAHEHLDGACPWCHDMIQPGAYVRLTLRDSGPGIGPEALKHLFEPFYTTKGVGQGPGLGLSMVQGVVLQSGGHVGVTSNTGTGTEFHIYFPAHAVPAAPRAQARAVRREDRAAVVLVVDDQDDVRGFVKLLLRSLGYHAEEARDAEQAVEICSNQPIDVVLTDVSMPRVSGPALAARLSRIRPGIRVLYMSGYAVETSSNDGGMQAGSPFLQKPFTPQELKERLQSVLQA